MNRAFRIIGITVLVIAVLALVYYFRSIVAYFLVAWVLSLLGHPVMDAIQRVKLGNFKVGNTLAAGVTLVVFLLVLVGMGWIFVPTILGEFRNLASIDINQLMTSLDEPIANLTAWLAGLGLIAEGDTNVVQELGNAAFELFDPARASGVLTNIIGKTGSMIMALFSVFFITFFFLADRDLFGRIFEVLTPDEYDQQIRNSLNNAQRMLRRYFGGIFAQVTVLTIIMSITLRLLGIENALLIGFFAALINVIPYLGPFIGAAFASFIIITGNLDADFGTVIMPKLVKTVLAFVGMQMFDNFLLQPFIFSKSVKAHPLEIFVVILAAAQLGGVMGMIIAIPTYTVLRVFLREFFSQFQVIERITRGVG